MNDNLNVGHSATVSVVVDESLTVPAVSDKYPGFATMPPVFATAYMVGFAECAAMAALHPFLDDNESSVGVEVRFDHTAATPVGMTVTAEAIVTAIEGRMISFDVVLRDDVEPIGRGTHQRAIIDKAKFEARAAKKAGAPRS
ncbi:thioesterase family protein [Nigerium massiliense]|uniref:thioesterase family protein n=1 Tax=Nigerium massiliense TaxID=1522317 RepID=UPI00058AD4AC|nr:thioesterase family protein [Nigerium massiliense]